MDDTLQASGESCFARRIRPRRVKDFSLMGEEFRGVLDKKLPAYGIRLLDYKPDVTLLIRLFGGKIETVGLYREMGPTIDIQSVRSFTVRVRSGYSGADPSTRFRLTKGFSTYALGVIGGLYATTGVETVPGEAAAEFARGFLMPEELVHRAMHSIRTNRSRAALFGVTDRTFRRRGWELGLLEDHMGLFESEDAATDSLLRDRDQGTWR